jgi:hypothetical protein
MLTLLPARCPALNSEIKIKIWKLSPFYDILGIEKHNYHVFFSVESAIVSNDFPVFVLFCPYQSCYHIYFVQINCYFINLALFIHLDELGSFTTKYSLELL